MGTVGPLSRTVGKGRVEGGERTQNVGEVGVGFSWTGDPAGGVSMEPWQELWTHQPLGCTE